MSPVPCGLKGYFCIFQAGHHGQACEESLLFFDSLGLHGHEIPLSSKNVTVGLILAVSQIFGSQVSVCFFR
jgi:hypothetical protein